MVWKCTHLAGLWVSSRRALEITSSTLRWCGTARGACLAGRGPRCMRHMHMHCNPAAPLRFRGGSCRGADEYACLTACYKHCQNKCQPAVLTACPVLRLAAHVACTLPPLPPDAVLSSFKLHAFAMLTLTWALPALVLRRIEQQVGWVGRWVAVCTYPAPTLRHQEPRQARAQCWAMPPAASPPVIANPCYPDLPDGPPAGMAQLPALTERGPAHRSSAAQFP